MSNINDWPFAKTIFEQNREFSTWFATDAETEFSLAPVPTILIEDVSAIPFVDAVPGVEQYQHRARIRARDGDLFAASTEPDLDYEIYNREFLGFGSPDYVYAPSQDSPTAVARGCVEPVAFSKLVAWAKQKQRWVIHPYMGISDVWKLARKLSAESGRRGGVVGPTPAAVWVANDKRTFSEVVRRTVGAQWLAETRSARTESELVSAIRKIAKRSSNVGLKRTRCASAMGNRVFRAEELQVNDDAALERIVREFLIETEWNGDEDVLIVEWLETNTSPSTQLWIPSLGTPICEGVFEQILQGVEGMFVGSRPSTLPRAVNDAIAKASIEVATSFQSLGYVGRCSFDFVVEGDLEGDFRAVFTECNGRWGGTSTPMFLIDRLIPDVGKRPMYRAQDIIDPSWVGATFADLLPVLEDDLYDPKTGQGQYVLYNVGPLKTRGKFDVICLAESSAEADEGIEKLQDAIKRG